MNHLLRRKEYIRDRDYMISSCERVTGGSGVFERCVELRKYGGARGFPAPGRDAPRIEPVGISP